MQRPRVVEKMRLRRSSENKWLNVSEGMIGRWSFCPAESK